MHDNGTNSESWRRESTKPKEDKSTPIFDNHPKDPQLYINQNNVADADYQEIRTQTDVSEVRCLVESTHELEESDATSAAKDLIQALMKLMNTLLYSMMT